MGCGAGKTLVAEEGMPLPHSLLERRGRVSLDDARSPLPPLRVW
jgi:hypothetical protein